MNNPLRLPKLIQELVHGLGGIEIRAEAVGGSQDSSLRFYYNEVETTGGSLYHNRFAGSVLFDSSNVVATRSFSEILAELGGSVDFMKMDCEGCEYAMFRGTSDTLLRYIKNAAGEVHPLAWARRMFGRPLMNQTHVELCKRRWHLISGQGPICRWRGGRMWSHIDANETKLFQEP